MKKDSGQILLMLGIVLVLVALVVVLVVGLCKLGIVQQCYLPYNLLYS